jgi:hypothetical protein
VAGDRAELTGATDAAGSPTTTVERAVDVGERWQSCLVRVQGERGGERARQRAQMSRGNWASGARALKGPRACCGGRKTRRCGHVHDGGVGRRLGMGSDGWGSRGRERVSTCVRGSAPTGRPHRAARGREGEKGRAS